MTDVDREQLRRDCSDALEVLLHEQRTDQIAELMHGALRDGQENAITWHLIHVLEKLEKEVR